MLTLRVSSKADLKGESVFLEALFRADVASVMGIASDVLTCRK